ncbi:hypothetical protein CHU95_03485 [Niveispirillum lacus]|uniref:AAA+ ATPase domain-containing protein n=1 Tax=Niveispirillum lacus TaxID=1981099 RepID=A0A255Z5N2_9PROT|nr:DEAD/DEAH box helicase [Niveispirillum lacus]OYQ36843.1 hypothetical protein CHU95_03485 [Niveispirillum lacus]
MIHLALAGISMGAMAVQWWLGDKTEEQRRELLKLEREREDILAADAQRRRTLLGPWMAQVRLLIAAEIEMREQIEPELRAALKQASALAAHHLRPVGENALRRTIMELEHAVGIVEAERAHLEWFRYSLPTGVEDLFSLERLQMPTDYPARGALLQLEAGTKVHRGYVLRGNHCGELVAVHDVDHHSRTASVCPLRGELLRLARNGTTAFEVTVEGRMRDGLRVSITPSLDTGVEGGPPTRIEFRLPLERSDPRGNTSPGAPLSVFSRPWVWAEIDRAVCARPGTELLDVGFSPTVRREAKEWSPIPLACRTEQLLELQEAWDRIEKSGALSRPWRVSMQDQGVFVFQVGEVALRMRCKEGADCFQLLAVDDAGPRPPTSVRIHAEVGVFVPGSGAEQELTPGLFQEFMDMLAEELANQRINLMDRHTALHLRKMQVLFEDLRDMAERDARVEVFATGRRRAGKAARCIVLQRPLPAWLLEADAEPLRVEGVDAVGQKMPLRALKVFDDALGLVEISFHDANADAHALRYLAVVGASYTQEIMARSAGSALEKRFVSPTVRADLFHLEEGPANTTRSHANTPSTIIDTALADEGVFAVWGPPGTGKTTLVVALLRRFLTDWESSGKPLPARVLVVAPTHVAVNEVMQRLLKEAPGLAERIVRYVAQASRIEGTSLVNCSQDRLIESWRASALAPASGVHPGWRALIEGDDGTLARGVREALSRWILAGREVHAVTSMGMSRADFALLDKEFDLVVFDEAGKAFAPEILLPAMRAHRLVLVGDHKQLPPTVTEEMLGDDGTNRLDPQEVEALLRDSYFHHLFQSLPDSHKAMLAVQHRMHPKIGAAVSELFYEGRLKSSRQDTDWALTRQRLTIVDCSDVPEYRHRFVQGKSLENEFERRVAVELVAALATDGACLVICPYQAQRVAVEHEIRRRCLEHRVQTTTVDAVQGGEADIVLLLMTRSGGNTNFLLDENRMNVALSRARECAIVIGHVRALTVREANPISRLLIHGKGACSLLHLRVPAEGSIQEDIVRQVVCG